MSGWIGAVGDVGRTIWAQEIADRVGGAVCGVFGADRMGFHLRVVCDVADGWRCGDRDGVECFADVHRGSEPGAVARAVGDAEPADDRGGDTCGTDRELVDRGARAGWSERGNDTRVMEWALRVEVDVYGGGGAIGRAFRRDIFYSGESSVAGAQRR